jgi:crossover junction endodeoxyribonuclease RuvC
VDVADMPIAIERKKRRVDAAALGALLRRYGPASIWMEQVHAMPRQGVASTFSFGMAYGIVLGVAGALSIPLTTVPAAQWKTSLRVPHAKGEARARASQLIPSGSQWWQRAKDDGRAEAALIGLYGVTNTRQTHEW